jgi:hypothetical protein
MFEVPRGFIKAAKTMPWRKVAKKFELSERRTRALMHQTGAFRVRKETQRVMPVDFPRNAHLPKDVLREMYSTGDRNVIRWRKECGYVSPIVLRFVPPENFEELVQTKTYAEVSEICNVTPGTISLAVRKLGIVRKAPVRPKPASTQRTHGPKIAPIPHRESTHAADAQRHLQRYMAVFRAKVVKRNATGWVVGGRNVTEDEMMQMARDKGWRQDAWKDLAA